MTINTWYEFEMSKIRDGRYSIRCTHQNGRNEILDRIIRFNDEIWVKEHQYSDIINYHGFEICHRINSSYFSPIVFHMPDGFNGAGLIKSHGLKDAIIFQNHNGKYQVFVFENENAKSSLYLEYMDMGFYDGEIVMIESELAHYSSRGVK